MTTLWAPGDVIVRREVLGLGGPPDTRPILPEWHGRAWAAIPVYVVDDSGDEIVTYIPTGAELGFVDGAWPTSDGRHPWDGRAHWVGHGALMVQRVGDPYAVWHFWTGPDRAFKCWYLNLQAPFRRSSVGYDTQDFELDILVFPDGSWVFKDLELLDERVREGRFTAELVEWVREIGDELAADLDAGRHGWNRGWADWTPDERWGETRLPGGWDAAP